MTETDADLARSILACCTDATPHRRRPPRRRGRRRPGPARRGRDPDVLVPVVGPCSTMPARPAAGPGDAHQRSRPGARARARPLAHADRSPAARDRRGLPLLRRAPARRPSRGEVGRAPARGRVAAGHRAACDEFLDPRLRLNRGHLQRALEHANDCHGDSLRDVVLQRTSTLDEELLDARMTEPDHRWGRAGVDRPRGGAPRRGCRSPAGRGPSRSWRCSCGTSCTPASAEPVPRGLR